MFESFAISASAAKKAAVATLVVIVPIAIAFRFGGTVGLIGVLFGLIGGITPALLLPGRAAAGLAVPIALAGGVAAALAGQAFPAAAFAALTCFLIAPANVLSNGMLAAVPTMAALFGAIQLRFVPWQVSAWMLGGSLFVVVLLWRAKKPPSLEGVSARTAWTHASVMAVAVAVTQFAVVQWEIPHGYWATMTMTIVLRPYGKETRAVAEQRVAGTVLGALLALILILLVPRGVALGIAAALMVVMLAYAMERRYAQQVMFMTPFVLLLSSGASDEVYKVALERVLATIAAAIVAAALALWLARLESEPAHQEGRPAPSGS